MKISLAVNVALKSFPMEERLKKAKEAGYDGVDLYMDHDAYDPAELGKMSEKTGMRIMTTGVNKCFANTLNKRWDDIRPAWEEAIQFAKVCGAKGVAALGGFAVGDFEDPILVIMENCRRLADLAAKDDITIMLEPINNVLEHQTAYLHSSARGLEIVRALNHPYLKLLYDFIHLESSEGNVLLNSTRNVKDVYMFHVGGIPAHDEPFNSPLDYPYLLKKIEDTGFDGFVGCEYEPSYDEVQSVNDVIAYLKSYKTRETQYCRR